MRNDMRARPLDYLEDSFARLLEATTALFKVEASETIKLTLEEQKKKWLVPVLAIPVLLVWAALAVYDLLADFWLYAVRSQFPSQSATFHIFGGRLLMLVFVLVVGYAAYYSLTRTKK